MPARKNIYSDIYSFGYSKIKLFSKNDISKFKKKIISNLNSKKIYLKKIMFQFIKELIKEEHIS